MSLFHVFINLVLIHGRLRGDLCFKVDKACGITGNIHVFKAATTVSSSCIYHVVTLCAPAADASCTYRTTLGSEAQQIPPSRPVFSVIGLFVQCRTSGGQMSESSSKTTAHPEQCVDLLHELVMSGFNPE